jgi:hypothetical protein
MVTTAFASTDLHCASDFEGPEMPSKAKIELGPVQSMGTSHRHAMTEDTALVGGQLIPSTRPQTMQ